MPNTYTLDMGYKSYRTTCDVPELVLEALKQGLIFIPIQETDGRAFLININRCDAITINGAAKTFAEEFFKDLFSNKTLEQP